MLKRTKLADRALPVYSNGEELANTATHALGGILGVIALILCVRKAYMDRGAAEITGAAIYGACLIVLYGVSSVYHGLRPGVAKKVLQILDHCAIYFLIAGSYTIVCLGALRRENAMLGWGILGLEWVLCTLATVLTAIDLKRYNTFSMMAINRGHIVIASVLRTCMIAIDTNSTTSNGKLLGIQCTGRKRSITHGIIFCFGHVRIIFILSFHAQSTSHGIADKLDFAIWQIRRIQQSSSFIQYKSPKLRTTLETFDHVGQTNFMRLIRQSHR